MTPAEEKMLREAYAAAATAKGIHAELLEKRPNGQPGAVLTMMVTARENGIEAMQALLTVSAEDPKQIRALQARANYYLDMIAWIEGALIKGIEADVNVSEQQSRTVLEDVEEWRNSYVSSEELDDDTDD